MDLPVGFEIATFVGLAVLLLGDLAIVARRPHEPSMKEASLWVGFYVGLALLFGLLMLAFGGGESATEFYAGWLTEYSLTVIVAVLVIATVASLIRTRGAVIEHDEPVTGAEQAEGATPAGSAAEAA